MALRLTRAFWQHKKTQPTTQAWILRRILSTAPTPPTPASPITITSKGVDAQLLIPPTVSKLCETLDQEIAANPTLALAFFHSLSPQSKVALRAAAATASDGTLLAKPAPQTPATIPIVTKHHRPNFDQLQSTFAAMDADHSGTISVSEFHAFMSKYQPIDEAKQLITTTTTPTPQTATPATPKPIPIPTFAALFTFSVHEGLPFVGFGFIDNALMILCGEAIDMRLGATLGLSTMAAAGLGNMLSDVAGVGMGSTIEAITRKLGIVTPKLTRQQLTLTRTRMAASVGCGVGVAVGCVLGMFPLLFLDDPRKKD